jgi:hypothetical protein
LCLCFDLERGERTDRKCIKYGLGGQGQWSNKGIPLSSCTKSCVFDERSPLSGAVEETMERQIASKAVERCGKERPWASKD